jgi:RND family efflux transporter MFP subunit
MVIFIFKYNIKMMKKPNINMNYLNTRKRKIIAILIIVLALASVAFAALNRGGSSKNLDGKSENLPLVELISAREFAGSGSINLIGSVRAFSETSLTAEASGRITSVPVSLGDEVFSGQIIATIENASEQAAVLQAEGAYEAALASSNQTSTGNTQNRFENKKDEIISVMKKAYISADNIIKSKIDLFIDEPESRFPEFSTSLSDYFLRQDINKKRQSLQSTFEDWDILVDSLTVDSISLSDLEQAISYLREIEELMRMISNGSVDFDSNSTVSDSEISAYISNVSSSRNTVSSLIIELNQNKESLRSSTSEVTILDAQLKQSLGSLNAAKANLAKTIIRSPISGTVNNLSVRTGDFVSVQQRVAEIANNNALEIVTFVGTSDKKVISVGAEVTIEDEFIGVITEIAPAIDSSTGKTEVRIASESSEFQNGDTVRITKSFEKSDTTNDIVNIPLSAIKFQLEDGFVFVLENQELVLRPIILGTIRGGSAEVIEGLSAQDEFVLDARGLVEGTKVEIKQ